MSNEPLPHSEFIPYQTEDGRTRIQCRFDQETLWLTQAQIADLSQTTPQNVTLHLKAIFAEDELAEAATCKDYLQVRSEGGRAVTRKLRQWATARLSEYLVKGFTLGDERLKQSGGGAYFNELLENIRNIGFVLKPTVYALE